MFLISEKNNKPILIVIGNSNVGKSSLTRYLIRDPKSFKGKSGKLPGTTLLLKKIQDPETPYDILDLPGFGYMKGTSKRRTEHIKKMMVIHLEKHNKEFFLALVVVNILRIRDELEKWFYKSDTSIPLTFELITLFKEFNVPIVLILNKIDKLNTIDRKNTEEFFIEAAKKFGIKPVRYEEFKGFTREQFPVLLTSASKKINVEEMKQIVQTRYENKFLK